MKNKVGLGFDVHRLAPGRPLYLGGIVVPFSKGLVGHSDGDCLVHALIDALLGAAGEKDIGQLFPDSDPRFKNISGKTLLRKTVQILKKKKIQAVNIDAVVIAEEPKLAPHIPQMKKILAPILGLSCENISIKAKTHEGLGPIGHREAIAAWVCLLVEQAE